MADSLSPPSRTWPVYLTRNAVCIHNGQELSCFRVVYAGNILGWRTECYTVYDYAYSRACDAAICVASCHDGDLGKQWPKF